MTDEAEQSEPKDSEAQSTPVWGESKGIKVFLAVVVALAVIGFFVGTQGERYEAQLHGFSAEERSDHDVEPARSYSELMDTPYRGNTQWEKSLQALSKQRPGWMDEVERTEELTQRALSERLEHRAYEGAPPTVPHPIREKGYAECMACHGEGLKIDGQLATPISHEYMANCTQCHVPETGSLPAPDERYDELPLDNAFAGLQRWGSGQRAHPGAPPTTPHPETMREDCMSCHGTMARPGLRTTHPWQTSCTQCHAPSATLDQQPVIADLPPVGEP